MRNPERIDRFCDELKSVWHCVPDWRFGQLMSNMLGAFVQETGKDIFYPEDDEMMEFFTKYVGLTSPYFGDVDGGCCNRELYNEAGTNCRKCEWHDDCGEGKSLTDET